MIFCGILVSSDLIYLAVKLASGFNFLVWLQLILFYRQLTWKRYWSIGWSYRSTPWMRWRKIGRGGRWALFVLNRDEVVETLEMVGFSLLVYLLFFQLHLGAEGFFFFFFLEFSFRMAILYELDRMFAILVVSVWVVHGVLKSESNMYFMDFLSWNLKFFYIC